LEIDSIRTKNLKKLESSFQAFFYTYQIPFLGILKSGVIAYEFNRSKKKRKTMGGAVAAAVILGVQ
jgi:hypothetical protein